MNDLTHSNFTIQLKGLQFTVNYMDQHFYHYEKWLDGMKWDILNVTFSMSHAINTTFVVEVVDSNPTI